MSQVYIQCEVSPGLRESEQTVAVADVFGCRQFLRVEKGYLSNNNGHVRLPVGIVGLDEAKQLALIELPHESDAGISRIWVRMAELENVAEVVS